jgi:hypothetical protein
MLGLATYQGYAAYRQAQTSNMQTRYRAGIAEKNAAIVRQEGRLARDMALRLEADSRRQTDQLLGVQRAKMGASGFVVGEGSFGDILDATALLGEADALAIQYEGELEEFRKEREARALEAEARALRRAQIAPGMAALTAFLGAPGVRTAIAKA